MAVICWSVSHIMTVSIREFEYLVQKFTMKYLHICRSWYKSQLDSSGCNSLLVLPPYSNRIEVIGELHVLVALLREKESLVS